MNTALFYDSETTGLVLFKEPSEHPGQPHIVQLAATLVDMDTRKTIASMDVIVKPEGWTIPDEVTAIHGITTEHAMAVGIPEEMAVRMLLAMWRGRTLIGHNEAFDRRIVRIALKRLVDGQASHPGYVPPSETWKAADSHCTCQLARPHTRLEKNKLPKLGEAYQHFTGQPLENAHSAMADVQGCMAVYWAIKDLDAKPLAA